VIGTLDDDDSDDDSDESDDSEESEDSDMRPAANATSQPTVQHPPMNPSLPVNGGASLLHQRQNHCPC
jgi:hypothetical protein